MNNAHIVVKYLNPICEIGVIKNSINHLKTLNLCKMSILKNLICALFGHKWTTTLNLNQTRDKRIHCKRCGKHFPKYKCNKYGNKPL